MAEMMQQNGTVQFPKAEDNNASNAAKEETSE